MKLRRMDTTGAVRARRRCSRRWRTRATSAGTDGDDRAGVVLGTYSAGGQATNEYLDALFKGGPTGAPALLFNSTVGNAAAGLAGLEFKLRGPNATISQKEASGLAAIAIGRRSAARTAAPTRIARRRDGRRSTRCSSGRTIASG